MDHGIQDREGTRRKAAPVRYWLPGDAMFLEAPCFGAARELLQRYDHHVVHANGIHGVLITYHWPMDDVLSGADTRVAYLLLNPSGNPHADPAAVRRSVRGHPEAPRQTQETIDRLAFHPSSITLDRLMP